MPHLRGEQFGSDPALAVGRRQDDVPQVRLEGDDGGAGRFRGGSQSWRHGGDRGVDGSGSVGGRDRLVDQSADPWQLLQRRLRLEPPDRPPGMADDRLAACVEDGR